MGRIVNHEQRLPTHTHSASSPLRLDPNEGSYFISPIHISQPSYRLSLSLRCVLSLSSVFYRVWGNEIQAVRGGEKRRGRKGKGAYFRQQGLAAIRAAGFLRESLADGLHLEVRACPQTLVRSHRAATSTMQSFKPECLNHISPFTIQPGPDAPAR